MVTAELAMAEKEDSCNKILINGVEMTFNEKYYTWNAYWTIQKKSSQSNWPSYNAFYKVYETEQTIGDSYGHWLCGL